eukprot:GHVR01115249.1.p1 GENE.GHVR01115249.1~~GHVR01115249.1.p1  ORF type:complete len:178 (+),score=20.10 GHVR01115249.1:455-988(+)
MACSTTLTGRALTCKDALGGIREAYIGLYLGATQWDVADATTGLIADADVASTVYQFEPQQGSSSFTQTVNASTENGSVFYTQVLSLSLNKMSALDTVQAAALNKARLTVIVVDKNGTYWVMGAINGCEVTGGTFVSGQAAGDLNGMTIELTAMELEPAKQLSAVVSTTDLIYTAGA